MAACSQLIASVESLGVVHMQREILQGSSLSPLLSTLCVITLSFILRKIAASYEWGDKELRINHLLFLDGSKWFAQDKDQKHSLV